MDRLQEQMICSRAVSDGYIETIRGLKNQLTEEKSRVLILSTLCGHVRTLSNALSSYVQVRHYYDYTQKLITLKCTTSYCCSVSILFQLLE